MLSARNESGFRSSAFLIASAILIALLTCASSVGAWFENVASDENQVETGIQRIRQLKFKKPVPILHKTRAQVAQILMREVANENGQQQESDARVAAGTMLGRYHHATDVKAQSVKLYLSQIDAFYDFRRKEMVILEGPRQIAERLGFRFVGYGDWRDDMVLAHELTHALQDQNFQAGSRITRISDNSDAVLAFKSLIEGDAVLAGFAYVRGGMDESLADFITAHLSDLPQVSAAQSKNMPDALSIPFLFQYAEGTAFVREAYRRGGWDSVDAAFRNPPESSQQIIDPSLYFDHPTRPVRIQIGGYQKKLAGWKKILEDTYGELALRMIMQMSFGREASQVEVARRWTGDKMVVLRRGTEETVIWMIAFDNEQGASLFADFYSQVLDTVDGTQNPPGTPDALNHPTPHEIDQVGNKVLVVAGPGASKFSTLAPSIWQASKVIDPNSSPPPAPSADDDQTNAISNGIDHLKDMLRDWFLYGVGRGDPLRY